MKVQGQSGQGEGQRGCKLGDVVGFICLRKLREVCIFMGGTYFFAMKIFTRTYLLLDLEVCTCLYIDRLGFMVVAQINQ